MSAGELEVLIKVFGEHLGEHLTLINANDNNHIYVMTDIDQRQIKINVHELRTALRKITTK